LCYGMDLATEALVDEGQAVGIIAAQSIGEPGTQFMFRIFHGGGIKLAKDIAADLPRVNQLFEGRVAVPDHVQTQGRAAVGEWLVQELQKVYRGQRLVIDDKHFEIIGAQMLRRVRVQTPGDTSLYPAQLIDRHIFAATNRHLGQGVKMKSPHDSLQESCEIQPRNEVEVEGRRPATGIPVLLGITEAVAESESFLAAASFQGAANVLADAALAGQTDPLLGLKENVMRGGLIPAGTGWRPTPREPG